MKIFDFLVKTAIFRAFLFFSERFSSCTSARIKCSSQTVYGCNAWRKSPDKKEKCPKNGYFDEKIKNFHKSKVDGLKKLTTRSCLYHDLMHFRGCPFTKISVFSGGYRQNSFFSTFLTLPYILEIAYFLTLLSEYSHSG